MFQHTCITICLNIEDAAFNAARDYCALQESQDGQATHKEGGVIVAFPPHYTNCLQPIDIAVMGPLRQNMLLRRMTGWLPFRG